MGIQSSLYSGVSGLNANGNALTVLGNNIANSNTIGFKASRTVFSDLLSAEIAGSGGTSQVGRGTGMSTVDNIFSQGTFESTESNTDLAIEGPGFFMVSAPEESTINYTRAGAFRFDEGGTLVSPEGYAVQGYYLNDEGDTFGDVTDVTIQTRSFSPANPTTTITLSTNLNANETYLGNSGDGISPFDVNDPATTSNYASSVRIFDSLGREHLATTYFNKLDPADNPDGVMQWESHTVVSESEVESSATILADDNALADAELAVANLVADLATANNDVDDAASDLEISQAAVDGASATTYNTLVANRDAAYTVLDAALPASPNATYDPLRSDVVDAAAAMGAYIGTKNVTDAGYSVLVTARDSALQAVATQASADGLAVSEVSDFITAQGLVDVSSYTGLLVARDADQVTYDSFVVDQVAAQATYDVSYPSALSALAAAEIAASDWVEAGRSMLSFDTGGRLVNVKDLSNNIGTSPTAATDREYYSAGNLYITTSTEAEAYPLTTDLEEKDPQPTVGTKEGALSWINESEPTQQINMTFGATQYSSESDVISQSQDGYSTGTLVSLTIDNDGNVLGNYSNGEPRKLAKIALAKFSNPLGLNKVGNNMYEASDDSGTAIVGTVGSGVGRIFTNSLEMSNVDLAAEFVKMITTQRGFQANSKIITTTDELLGELINLKR